jgi:hypothetical protein
MVAGQGLVSAFPPAGLIEDVVVLLAVERCFGGLVLLKIVEVFQEQQPGGLLGVAEFGGVTLFSNAEGAEDEVEDVVGCGVSRDGIEGPQGIVEIEQQHFVRHFGADGAGCGIECGE